MSRVRLCVLWEGWTVKKITYNHLIELKKMYWTLLFLFYTLCITGGAVMVVFAYDITSYVDILEVCGVVLVVVGHFGMMRLFLSSIQSMHEELQKPLHRGLIQHECTEEVK